MKLTEMGKYYFSSDMDENPAMTLQVIKKTKRYGRTYARTT